METLRRINKRSFLFVLIFCGYITAKACSPMNTPVLTASAMVGGNLLLNVNSATIYNFCTYVVEVELVCNGVAMPGVAPFFYTSPAMTKTSTPQAYPQMTISLASLCQGGVYQFRWREKEQCCAIYSPWSTVTSFTMPGVPIPASLTIVANPPAICFPQTSQLTASVTGGCGGGGAGVTYSWTPVTGLSCGTCSNPIANPTITTTYTCVAKGAGVGSCWTASNVITISSFTVAPALGVASASPGCAGFPTTLSISSFSGALQWQSAPNNFGPWVNIPGATSSVYITPTLTAGNYCYQLVATGCGGSTNSNTVCTTVNPTPTITVNSPSLCAGQTASLLAGGGTSYVWSAGANITGIGSATATPPVNTSYTVIGTVSGCTASAVSNVTVFPYPVVNINSNSPVCAGSSINLFSTGGGNYQWMGPNGYASNVQNPVIASASVANAGVYNVIVTTNNCSTANTVNVVVLNPTVSASNTGPYCAGYTVHLNGNSSPVLSYAWSGPMGFNASTQNVTIPGASPLSSGVYTLSIFDGTCSASATTSVTINALPVPVILNNAPLCQASALSFSASGGVTYTWTGPNTFISQAQNPVINPVPLAAAGVYTLTTTDANGCKNSTIANVNILPLPAVNLTPVYVCKGNTASISTGGGVSYSWTGPYGFTSNNPNLIFTNVNDSVMGPYTVIVTGANSCTAAAGTSITVYPLPSPVAWCDAEVCLNAKVNFHSSGGVFYQWTGPNNFISSVQNPSLNSASNFAYTGTYTLGVTDNNGCQAQATTYLLVRALPVAQISANVNKKCVPFCTNFAISSTASLQSVDWNLSNGGFGTGNTYSGCFNNEGTYVMKSNFSDNFGCASSASFEINAYPIPVADFNWAPGSPTEREEINFTDASRGNEISYWSWYFAGNQTTSIHQNATHFFETAGEYPIALIVTNKWGCKDTVTKFVTIGEAFGMYVPDAFTPNGDGLNDTFQPRGHGFGKYHMQIFDRWGEKIFESNDYSKGWDGTCKGKPVKEDAYIYKVQVYDLQGKMKDYTGHVTIMR